MGSVLTPQLIGLESARDLPHASTFCGRCEEACPMRIPLPAMLRTWREQGFARRLDPPRQRAGLAAWGMLARRPGLYRLATGLMARCLGLVGRARGRFRRLPLAAGWSDHRDFPAPEGRLFRDLWAERERRRG
jgi:L-lactate dehydrogenase complex protein LldF